jgi:carbonic anhydrase
MAETTNAGDATPETNSSKSFLASAQEAIGEAVDATVEAVREHPIAAAAIATGAAAAVSGAVYAATQLGGDKEQPATKD